MGAETEGQVTVRVAIDPEVLRIAEHRLVEVRRFEHQHDLLAGFQRRAVELGVGGQRAAHVLHRRRPAQHLLDRPGQQIRLRHERLPLIAVTQQLLGAARQRVAGGLVAADQDQQCLEHDLVIRHPLALDLGVDQNREQVVGRVGATVGDHLHRERGVGGERVHQLLDGQLVDRRGQSAHQVVGPLQQLVALFGQHAEHVTDDRHRQRRGDVADEVALAALTHRVDQRVTQVLDGRHLVHDALAGEPGVDELAAQDVRRIVHVDHVGHPRLVRPDAAGGREQLRVALGVEQRLIGRRRGQSVAVAEHRLVGPHPLVGLPRIAVGVEVAVGQIDVEAGQCRGHDFPFRGCFEVPG